ncbi:hypothetical protein NUACC26_068890 [Scytonema sp. NUACC26]
MFLWYGRPRPSFIGGGLEARTTRNSGRFFYWEASKHRVTRGFAELLLAHVLV